MVKRTTVVVSRVAAMLRQVMGQGNWFLSSGIREVYGVLSSCRVSASGLELFVRDGHRTIVVVWRMTYGVAAAVVCAMGELS